MASSQDSSINPSVKDLSDSLRRTSLMTSTDDVLQSIDEILEGYSITEDEFDRISPEDLELLSESPVDNDTITIDESNTDSDMSVSIPVCSVQPQPRLVSAEYDDIESSDSITPPPTVSPIPPSHRLPMEPTKESPPGFFDVKVYGRQNKDFRSGAIFYGTYTTPYLPSTLKTKTQFNIFIDKALQMIQHSRPFSDIRQHVEISVSSPEITFVSELGHHISLYSKDFTTDVNLAVPLPKIYGASTPVPVTVSVLVHANFRPSDGPTKASMKRKRRSPSPPRSAACSTTRAVSTPDRPVAKKSRTKRNCRKPKQQLDSEVHSERQII